MSRLVLASIVCVLPMMGWAGPLGPQQAGQQRDTRPADAAPSSVPEPATSPGKEIAREPAAATEDVQQENHRLEITLLGSMSVAESYSRYYSGRLSLDYHFWDFLALEVGASYLAIGKRTQDYDTLLHMHKITLVEFAPQVLLDISAVISPVSGNANLLQLGHWHYKLYGVVGAGATGVTTSLLNTSVIHWVGALNLGFGVVVHLHRILALRLELRDHIFARPELSRHDLPLTEQQKFQNHVTVSAGLGIHLPLGF